MLLLSRDRRRLLGPANPTQVTPAAADAPTAEAINSHLAHSSPPLPFTISPFISVIIVIILVVSVSPTRCLSPFLTLMPRSHFLSLSLSHSLSCSPSRMVSLT